MAYQTPRRMARGRGGDDERSYRQARREQRALRRARRQMIALIVLVAVIILGMVGYILLSDKSTKETLETSQSTTTALPIDENQAKYEQPEGAADENRNITLPGWGGFTIPANTTTITKGFEFHNPDSNLWTTADGSQELYYMSFGLYLAENDELLYQSGLVTPGNYIQTMEMTRALTPGTYEAYVLCQPYLSDGVTPTNAGRVDITLTAQS